MYLLQTVSRGGPRARPEPLSPSPDLGLRMDRAPTYPPTPSPIGGNHAQHCGNGGEVAPPGHGWHKGSGTPAGVRGNKGEEEEEVEEGEKGGKTKRKKKKRKKEQKDDGGGGGSGGKWTFGALFRRKNKKKGDEEEKERAKESTEDEYGVTGHPPSRGGNPAVLPPPKRTKEEEEHLERQSGGHPCAMHNGCSGCVGHPSRGRYRPTFGSGSDCGRDPYGGGTALVRRDSSTSSHKERRELIKARVEAMRERLPRDSSSEDEMTQGGSEGSWEIHRSRRGIPLQPGTLGGHPPLPAGSVGSAGSSPYLGRRTKFTGRTERFHQRRLSKEYREEGDEEDSWRKRQNGLPPQCIPWRVSQSDAEAAYIGCRPGPHMDFGGLGSGSALSHSPGPSPMNSPLMGGRRSVSSAAGSPGYGADGVGFQMGNRCMPRRYPSTPISPHSQQDGHAESRAVGPPKSVQGFPTRSRSTDLLLCWRPEEGTMCHASEPNPFHFPSPTSQRKANVQRANQDANHHLQHLNARWPSTAPCRSPPPPPPPRDPQRRIAPPQCFPPHYQMREVVPQHDPGGYVTRRNFHQPQSQQPSQHPPPHQQPQENPYVNVMVHNGRPTMSAGVPQGVQACLADSQPRSRRPLRVTQGGGSYYVARPTDASYMSDSQVGSPGRRQVHPIMMQHPPLESHYAVPFLAESPPPRCVINRVLKDPPQVAEGVVHTSRPLMRQQRLPVLNRSRSSSPAPAPTRNRPPLLHIRPLDGSGDGHPFVQRGHSSAPQTPIDGPINRPLSIVSEEKGDVSPRIPPVPPARSSSRRSSISSLEALEYGVWGIDRPPRAVNKGPSGLEDALTELENIYKSLKFEDEMDGDTDSNAMGSSEQGLAYDDQDRPLTDDMAYRRLHFKEKTSPSAQHGVGGVVAQAGSYLLVSPTLGPAEPWTEPPPNSINPGEPDITLDDVVFRSVRQANAHISQDPQPPFGIPLGPVTRAPDSDYLHVKPPSPSPTSRASSKRTPDVVKDDLAFRSLRKDRTTHAQPVRPVPVRGISSPPPRPSSSFSCISSPPPLPTPTLDFQAIRKKRAVRSLSANLLGILQTANVSARSMSPPLMSKSTLPPQSPPSPRRDPREVTFPPAPLPKTTAAPQSPSKKVPTIPSVAQSEDSEPCNVVNTTQCHDATSSDTLTEGHADDTNSKRFEAKEIRSTDQPTSQHQPISNSPGEVYEALGRVLSRVGKEPDSVVKGSKSKGEKGDDLETLLVALAREARATSENLGRELDQLRTTTIKMTEELGKTQKKTDVTSDQVFSQTIEGIPKDVASLKSRLLDSVPGEELLRTKEYLINRSASPGKVGAIASLALRELEKPRVLSSSSSPDSTKMDGMSVVVGKCTVGKDSSHPGSIVSFTSSVGPIKSEAKRPSGKIDDSNTVGQVSATSVEIPMKSTGDISIANKESESKPSEVSTASASVPIKFGSSGFEVAKEMSGRRAEVESTTKVEVQANKGYHSEASSEKDTGGHLKTVTSNEKVPSTLRIVSKPVEDVRIGVKSRDNHGNSLPLEGAKSEPTTSVISKSIESKEASPTMTESTPITGSMRLVVRRDPELSSTSTAQESLQQCSWVVRSEPDQGSIEHRTPAFDSTERNDNSAPSDIKSNVPAKRDEFEVRSFGDSGFSFVTPDKPPVPAKDLSVTQSTSSSAVVEEIQKEFDQLLFSIPAKKARKSDEHESLREFSSTVRPRSTESKSLEHPRRTGRDTRAGHDGLHKTFPKTLGSSFAKSTGAFRITDATDGDDGKVEEVSSAFEREFEELWKATIKKDFEEMERRVRSETTATAGLDGALERQLDQLRAEVGRPLDEDEDPPKGAAKDLPSAEPPELDEKEAEATLSREPETEAESAANAQQGGIVRGDEST